MIITVLLTLCSLLGLICFIPDFKKEARYMYWGVGGDLRKLNFIQKLFIRVSVGTPDQINMSSNGMLRPNYLRIFGMFFIFVATILAVVNIFTQSRATQENKITQRKKITSGQKKGTAKPLIYNEEALTKELKGQTKEEVVKILGEPAVKKPTEESEEGLE